jgi:hypothetical protein
LLATTLIGLEDDSTGPKQGDLSVVYSFLHEIAKLLMSTAELALVTIVDELDNANILKVQLDEERARPNQAVWAAVGWLSTLLSPPTLVWNFANLPLSNALRGRCRTKT